ncbi:MAG: rhodanese-like domain-containing protein [Cyanobacteria bacterium]|nr:rhodanese-like domain-containing protein [Cyanobacteriota bacterium]MDA0865314.1 rhodanese-like domain-containing protein [Cyanobacteriota bacterium]
MVLNRSWFASSLKRSLVCNAVLSVAALLLLGMSACQSAPGSQQIAPEVLLAQLESGEAPLIVDVRSAAEYNVSHIPGAMHIPHRDLAHRLDELATFKTQPVILYCEAGVRAGIAETTLADAGFQQVIHLTGDMQDWRRKEFPVESRSIFP